MGLIETLFDIETDESGDYDVTLPQRIAGYLETIEWVDTDFAEGVDAVLSLVDRPSGIDKTILTLTDADTEADYPLRVQAVDDTGAAISGIYDLRLLVGKPRLVVSSGGNGGTGKLLIYWWRF